MKKTLTALGLAAAFLITPVVLAPVEAQARPVQDQSQYCGPGRTEYVFDVRTGKKVGHCTDYKARSLVVKRPPTWWNPWTWR